MSFYRFFRIFREFLINHSFVLCHLWNILLLSLVNHLTSISILYHAYFYSNNKIYLDTTQIGSLFTLFLHAPLLGFAFISNLGKISSSTWEKCVNLIAEAELNIVELFNSSSIGKILYN